MKKKEPTDICPFEVLKAIPAIMVIAITLKIQQTNSQKAEAFLDFSSP